MASYPASRAAIQGGASALGVALLQEGIALRNAGITAPVVVLAPTIPEQADSIVAHNLSQTIGHPDAIPPIEAAAKRPQYTRPHTSQSRYRHGPPGPITR